MINNMSNKGNISCGNPASELNLRVTADARQGYRPTMEDDFSVAYHHHAATVGDPINPKDAIYAYFGVFDGHGGPEASAYAQKHLLRHIISQEGFWSGEDEPVLGAIRNGFLEAQKEMQLERVNWKRTSEGFLSNAGTTASIAFLRRGKLFTGHVGDSAIILGYQDEDDPTFSGWKARQLTREHKLDDPAEVERIKKSGGSVALCSRGYQRVVWKRPFPEPAEVPLLMMSRALGNFWSYNSELDKFAVSPEPDTSVIDIDVDTFRCLVIASDGVLDMLSPQQAIDQVYHAHLSNIGELPPGVIGSPNPNYVNPSRNLVSRAMNQWDIEGRKADNATVVTVLIDPPGRPPREDDQSSIPILIPVNPSPFTTSTREKDSKNIRKRKRAMRLPNYAMASSTTHGTESKAAAVTNGHGPYLPRAQRDSETNRRVVVQTNKVSSSIGSGPVPSSSPLPLSYYANRTRLTRQHEIALLEYYQGPTGNLRRREAASKGATARSKGGIEKSPPPSSCTRATREFVPSRKQRH